jgi:hypothetical protein
MDHLDFDRASQQPARLADPWIVCATPDTCDDCASSALDDSEAVLSSPVYLSKHTELREQGSAVGRRFWRKCLRCGTLFNKNRSVMARATTLALVAQTSPDHALPSGLCDDCSFPVPASCVADSAFELDRIPGDLREVHSLKRKSSFDLHSDLSGSGSGKTLPAGTDTIALVRTVVSAPSPPPNKLRRLESTHNTLTMCDVAYAA